MRRNDRYDRDAQSYRSPAGDQVGSPNAMRMTWYDRTPLLV